MDGQPVELHRTLPKNPAQPLPRPCTRQPASSRAIGHRSDPRCPSARRCRWPRASALRSRPSASSTPSWATADDVWLRVAHEDGPGGAKWRAYAVSDYGHAMKGGVERRAPENKLASSYSPPGEPRPLRCRAPSIDTTPRSACLPWAWLGLSKISIPAAKHDKNRCNMHSATRCGPKAHGNLWGVNSMESPRTLDGWSGGNGDVHGVPWLCGPADVTLEHVRKHTRRLLNAMRKSLAPLAARG